MKITVCFTGGGTAGHVYPGLAVLELLKNVCESRGIESHFCWIGSKKGMEKNIVEENGIIFHGISAGKLRRYFSINNFTDIFRIISGFLKSLHLLSSVKPDLLFSKGGYVSTGPVMAAKILGIPVISHESDFTPGLATRINSRFSDIIMVSFSETMKYLKKSKNLPIIVTGNPVRQVFMKADPARGKKIAGISEDIPVIMVLGGSQGAREINFLVEEILSELLKECFVIHQAGENDYSGLSALPGSSMKRYKRYSFINSEIADMIAAADVVISRAGAGSVWELSSLGKACVMIPLRGKGTRGDQVHNASFLKGKKAAVVLDDEKIKPAQLFGAVMGIISDNRKKSELEQNIKSLGADSPASLIAEKILKFIGA